MRSHPRRLLLLAVLAVIAIGGGAFAALRHGSGDGPVKLAANECQKGFRPLSREYLREVREGARAADGGGEADAGAAKSEAEREAEGGKGGAQSGSQRERDAEQGSGGTTSAEGKTLCLRDDVRRPEPYKDLARVNITSAQRLGLERPGAYQAAVRQKARLAGPNTTVPGTAGQWTPVGNGPLIFDDPDHPDNFGLRRAAGRITDYAYDDKGKRLFAAVASGGVYASTDLGKAWTSIGDNLPTQSVGAVSWTPAGGGTVIALTGDNAFGGNTYAGNGMYWSTDLGKTWNKADGAPEGALGFRLAVQPDKPSVVYAATGAGLFRSYDAGRSWDDVVLPTAGCAGATFTKKTCFLANVVTDVVVQGPDKFGNHGGAVLAAVGWRQGRRKSPDGTVQAPANGLYRSDTGAKGSFRMVPDSAGFESSDHVGRVSLGVASGPDQNHDYVYALAQDSELFNTGKLEGLDTPGADPFELGIDPTATPTYIDAAYVTPDFGVSWTKMVTRQQFLDPANGSTLAQLSALGFGPGIQSWYNSWIQPDPNGQVNGVPTRVALGLEEIFETRTPGAPQNGPTDVRAVGPYAAFGGACVITLTGKVCGQSSQTSGLTTTHPDQHGAIYVPGADGSTLVVGNDGGAYTQKVPAAGNMTPEGFGGGVDEGFHTLLPYGLAVAKDGIVYAGLQDNGEMRIDKDGRQVNVYGGDGTFTVVDPDTSDVALEATPNGGLNRTVDGGKNWESVAPSGLLDPQFLMPIVLDPGNKKHIGIAGRNVFEASDGIENIGNGAGGDFQEVYDLGTAAKPGDKSATATDTDPSNLANAMAIQGNTTYVGYCGSCDPVRDNKSFKGGVATNVGGTWHIAKATGLPQRIINHVATDPADARTLYVALGESTARPYAPAQALGADGTDPDGGHVYKSTDGGESFTDVSGDLPDVGALWLLVKGKQLIAATTVGVFASRATDGKEWGLLGNDLPAAPVFSMTLDPANPNRLMIASLGRGIYSYEFADPTTTPGPNCRDTLAPAARYTKRAKTAKASRKLRLKGTASDRGCGKQGAGKVKRVTVSIARATGKRCRYLQADGKLARKKTSCLRTRYVAAKGTTRWSFTAKRKLPKGSYKIWVRAVDAAGNVEHKRYTRNGLRLRLR